MRRDNEFAEFFTSRFDAARRAAYALCGDWGDAEEIAQHAFVRIYVHWSRVRSETADAYLNTVVTRLFLDTRRRVRGREHPVADPPEQAEHAGFAPDERQALLSALRQVPARQREVLVLRFLQDMSVERTADTLGCTAGTVKSQTARGLNTLRDAYRAELGEPAPAPQTSVDDVMRRGRRRVFAQRATGVVGVLLVVAGVGVGATALSSAPTTPLPPADTITVTTTTPTTVRAEVGWPRLNEPTRTPTLTMSPMSGVPPMTCEQKGTPQLAGWPGIIEAPSNVRAALERAISGPVQYHVTPPRNPGERNSHALWANAGHGSIWLRAGTFTGSPLAHADDQKWAMGDCVAPKRHVLANGTVIQLHVAREGMPVPTLNQLLMIYTPAGRTYQISLSNHSGEFFLNEGFDQEKGGHPELPLSEQRLAEIGQAVAEAA
ncbi:RNA polymerase sigma-70 factor (sigma-E family) [Lentzea atacamensis]|uniref:RNA polymerase sigma factor n=1 Tax=Lentzea atacamensis TaxID=531938 RepID=A0A316I5R4_9PSEU|nr:SigE family RNA polymerase sigma factor [Lentzea atacamensis]PWK88772.1 RNA polymerase sigma-70 factor (sigma-E family) [Lentzea atacamensis]